MASMSARALLAAAILTALAGCGGEESQDRELLLLAPAGYVEDGSTTPTADWVTPFERQTGCSVTVRVYDDDEDVMAIAKRRRADAAAATLEHFDRLRAADDLSSVDVDRIPAYEALDPRLRRLFPEGVPHAWSDLAVFANYPHKRTEGAPAPYENLAAIFVIPDSPLMFHAASVEATRRFLDAGLPIWRDDVTAAQALRTRPPTIAGIARRTVARLAPGTLMPLPAGTKTVGWATAWAIRADGNSDDCAHRWIAHVTSAPVNRRSAAFTGEEPANCVRRCRSLAPVRFPLVTPEQRQLWEELTSQ
jgi:putative spermidine/putrescine transport system substrate-binding protein